MSASPEHGGKCRAKRGDSCLLYTSIFDDCDIDQAVEGVATGILFNQGQVCCAGSRVFIQEGIFDEFLAKLKATFEDVKVGDPTDPQTQLGAQIYKKQQEKVLSYIKIGLDEGATLVTGGERCV